MPKIDEGLQKAVAEYVEQYGVKTTREIIGYIEDTLGRTPSTGTIAAILRRLGYQPVEPAYWEKSDAN